MTLTIDFRPDTGNGLLVYTGEHWNARADFFSLVLIENYVEFRLVGVVSGRGSGGVELRRYYDVEVSGYLDLTI